MSRRGWSDTNGSGCILLVNQFIEREDPNAISFEALDEAVRRQLDEVTTAHVELTGTVRGGQITFDPPILWRKFWLYIVTEAASEAPQLHRIQNPAAHFRMGEGIFATGFIVPEKKWREKAGGGWKPDSTDGFPKI